MCSLQVTLKDISHADVFMCICVHTERRYASMFVFALKLKVCVNVAYNCSVCISH